MADPIENELNDVLSDRPAAPNMMSSHRRPVSTVPSHEPVRFVSTSNERLGGLPTVADTLKWQFDRIAKGVSFGIADFPWSPSTRQKFAQLDKRDIDIGGIKVNQRAAMEEVGGLLLPIPGLGRLSAGVGKRALGGIERWARRKVGPEVMEYEIAAESRRRAAEALAGRRGVGTPEFFQKVSTAIEKKAALSPAATTTAAQEAGQKIVKTTKISPKTLRPLTKKGHPIQTARKVETTGTGSRKVIKGGNEPTIHDLTEEDIYGRLVQNAPTEAGLASRLGPGEALRKLSPAGVMGVSGRPAAIIRLPQLRDPSVALTAAKYFPAPLPLVGGTLGAATGQLSPIISNRWRGNEPLNPMDPLDMELMRILSNKP